MKAKKKDGQLPVRPGADPGVLAAPGNVSDGAGGWGENPPGYPVDILLLQDLIPSFVNAISIRPLCRP